MNRLLEESKRIKSQADRILGESGIIKILESYGVVKIGGSYALDVMLRPDIDLFVVTDKHDWDKLLEIQYAIIKLKYFRELDFVNWVDFEDLSLTTMKGYYLLPWIPIDNQLWKIDIWLITTSEYAKTSQTRERFKKMLDDETNDSKKITILEIKESTRKGNKYIKGVDGNLIYKAVLEDGIKRVVDFKKLMESQK